VSGRSIPRVTLKLSGGEDLFEEIISAEIVRDLEEISGGFQIECLDLARMQAARPAWWKASVARAPIQPGERVVIALDGEVVLVGWLDRVEVNYGPDKVSMLLSGRDVTGDLVDCAAAPNGPAEYSNLTLTELCARICAPFGISVTADVDVGGTFPKFGIEPAETAMSAIEKACRQRAVLAVSDGVGGLLLTRGGRGKAPAPLVFGENVQTMDATFDHAERYAEYICKGQGGPASARPAMDRIANPLVVPAPGSRPAPTSSAGSRPRVVMTGRATDPAVTRYRPTVLMAKTQSGGASVQEQADWKMRTARAKSESLRMTLPDWRAGEPMGMTQDGELTGEKPRLWRINERALVDDPLSQASAELLIAGVTWRYSKEGAKTELRLCGCDAFDVLAEPGETARVARPRRLDGVANPLVAPAAPGFG
jgi:prophage tail gpP-like protein